MNEELLNRIQKDIKETLSEYRYIHSVGVMKKAEELAQIYNVDVEKAKLVGISHDIAKEFSPEEALKYVKDNNIKIDEIERINTVLLHGKIGADIVKKKYGFTKDMQDAISFHTTTNKNMDMLAKILYVADKIEENRPSGKYNIEYERKIANKNIDETIIYIINESIQELAKKNILIHPNCIETRNKILLDLKKK